jgi:allophanate hydrolase subunit 1
MNQNEIVSSALANADADVQADVLNKFAAELTVICKGRRDSQLFYIAKELQQETVNCLMEIVAAFNSLKEDVDKKKLYINDLYADIARLEARKRELDGQ